MPRSYGITNVAPYPSAPAVGNAGDEYWNSATKTLYISDGTNWNPSGGAPYAPVSSTPPNASAPTVAPPMGLLFVDTSVTSASFQGPPGQPDLGVNSGTPDINTFQTSGNTVITGTPSANAPPIPAGPFILEVLSLGNGSYIQQRATSIAQNQYIATRVYTAGAWQAWHSPGAGTIAWFATASAQATSGTATLTVLNGSYTFVAGRNYLTLAYFRGYATVATITNASANFNMPGGGAIGIWQSTSLGGNIWGYGFGMWLDSGAASGTRTMNIQCNVASPSNAVLNIPANGAFLQTTDLGTG
jgi:hypothetical protein